MATLTQIRAAIKTKIEGVTGAGVVHDRPRFADRMETFRSLYMVDGEVRGWHIERVSTVELRPAIGRYILDHRWRITGYRGFVDADSSGTDFDAVIENVRAAFRADDTLGGLIVSQKGGDTPGGPAGAQVEDSGPAMFCGVLVHRALLGLVTKNFL